jgi:hypothetical protein
VSVSVVPRIYLKTHTKNNFTGKYLFHETCTGCLCPSTTTDEFLTAERNHDPTLKSKPAGCAEQDSSVKRAKA